MELTLGTWRIAIEQVRPSRSELAQTYNMAAAKWENSITRLGYVDAYSDLFQQMASNRILNHLNPTSEVLDAGIGTGALSNALLSTIKQPIHLHGIDISDAMLKQAGQHLASRTKQLTLSQQDVNETTYTDSRFDLVIAAHTLEHLDDPLAGLRELVRVLKPGHPLLLVISRRHVLSAWLNIKWAISRTTPSDLEACFVAAGLRDIKLLPLSSRPWVKHMSIACIGFKQINCVSQAAYIN